MRARVAERQPLPPPRKHPRIKKGADVRLRTLPILSMQETAGHPHPQFHQNLVNKTLPRFGQAKQGDVPNGHEQKDVPPAVVILTPALHHKGHREGQTTLSRDKGTKMAIGIYLSSRQVISHRYCSDGLTFCGYI